MTLLLTDDVMLWNTGFIQLSKPVVKSIILLSNHFPNRQDNNNEEKFVITRLHNSLFDDSLLSFEFFVNDTFNGRCNTE